MKKTLIYVTTVFLGLPSSVSVVVGQPIPRHPVRNIVIFVADGLRHGSVNEVDTPTLSWIQKHGVNFTNSHSLFPTFTTANASAIATGHYLGDTGDYSNTIYSGYPVFHGGDFGRTAGTYTPFVEDDPVLGDLDLHYGGNYLNEETLLSAARKDGFNTAVVGKLGPAAIQDVEQLNPVNGQFVTPQTVMIDDWTGTEKGIPLSTEMTTALIAAGLPIRTPDRVQPAGTATVAGTTYANCGQQVFFVEATTRALLPMFHKSGKPFVLVYWSRDPDGTQHTQGDSLNKLSPGINGSTSRAALRNADDNLKQILEFIEKDSALNANTDIFVTSDHGFATISKNSTNAAGHSTSSIAARSSYKDGNGEREVAQGFLPVGFLAIDLAQELGFKLFDPDKQMDDGATGKRVYVPVDPAANKPTTTLLQHPTFGNGLLGGSGAVLEQTDARIIVTANGGSDLVYLTMHDPELLKRIVDFLSQQDYVGGLFVDDSYGSLPGTLPLGAIGLTGSSKLPIPSVVVAFKTFHTDPRNPLMTAVQIADTNYQQGQGMHGSLGRDNTFNFMAAFGPDFKKSFRNGSPAGNADIAPTIAAILGLTIPSHGSSRGRVLEESLHGGPLSVPSKRLSAVAEDANHGMRTVLLYQRAGQQLYVDKGCFETAAGGTGEALCQE